MERLDRFAERFFMMNIYVVVQERGPAWNWSLPMRQQAQWAAHAAFMDELARTGFIVAGGPLGGEDDARRALHVVHLEGGAGAQAAIQARMAHDPWMPANTIVTISIDPWTILLGSLNPG